MASILERLLTGRYLDDPEDGVSMPPDESVAPVEPPADAPELKAKESDGLVPTPSILDKLKAAVPKDPYGRKNGMKALESAQSHAADANQSANFGHSLATLAAATGGRDYKPDYGYWEGVRSQSKQPIEDLKDRRGLMDADLGRQSNLQKMQNDAAANDKTALGSVTARSLLLESMPSIKGTMGNRFDDLTEAQIVRLFPFLKESIDAGVRKSEVDRKSAADRAKVEQDAKERTDLLGVMKQEFPNSPVPPNIGTDALKALYGKLKEDAHVQTQAEATRDSARLTSGLTASRQVDQEKRELGKEESARQIPGLVHDPAVPVTQTDVQNARKLDAEYRTLMDQARQFKKLYKQMGSPSLIPSEAQTQLAALAKNMQTTMLKVQGLGVPNGADWVTVKAQIPDPTQWNLANKTGINNVMSSLAQTIDSASHARENALRSSGYKPAGNQVGDLYVDTMGRILTFNGKSWDE